MTSKEKPELWIYCSDIYDKRIHEWKGLEYKDFSKEGYEYRKKLQREWDKIERKVFDTISEVSGLEWKKTNHRLLCGARSDSIFNALNDPPS